MTTLDRHLMTPSHAGTIADSAGDGDEDNGSVEWKIICVTLSDWERISGHFQTATHHAEKTLHQVLVTIVPVVAKKFRVTSPALRRYHYSLGSKEIERKRRLEEAVLHRKRSARIAKKEMENEEARILVSLSSAGARAFCQNSKMAFINVKTPSVVCKTAQNAIL
ncbi:hypothetical protein B0H14DRAFT_2620412 [Mycena olivaceomarginata]|nr:hypothetical protein B0H14DRAFT_2620412 [Mycena olivaceomarginata]